LKNWANQIGFEAKQGGGIMQDDGSGKKVSGGRALINQ
jgi:hypothetical protein